MTDPNAGRPVEGCTSRPLSGDLTCIYPAGHDEPHRNFQGIEWPDPERTPGRHVGAHHPIGSRCTLPHCPRVHDPEPRDLVAERLDAEEAIAGPRVAGRRAGKTSEQLEVMTRHANALAAELDAARVESEERRVRLNRLVLQHAAMQDDRDAWQKQHDAAVEYAETLERERDALREQRDLAERIAESRGDMLDRLDDAVMTAAKVLGIIPAGVGVPAGDEKTVGEAYGELHPDEGDDCDTSESSPCDATLDVDYGQEGQTVPCTMRGDHHRHAALIDGAAYRWETTR